MLRWRWCSFVVDSAAAVDTPAMLFVIPSWGGYARQYSLSKSLTWLLATASILSSLQQFFPVRSVHQRRSKICRLLTGLCARIRSPSTLLRGDETQWPVPTRKHSNRPPDWSALPAELVQFGCNVWQMLHWAALLRPRGNLLNEHSKCLRPDLLSSLWCTLRTPPVARTRPVGAAIH